MKKIRLVSPHADKAYLSNNAIQKSKFNWQIGFISSGETGP